MKVDTVFHKARFWNVDLAEAGEYWAKQLVLVLDYDEEARCVSIEFNATSKGRLGVRSQFVGVGQENRLESGTSFHVCFSKELYVIPHKLDTFAVCTIYVHNAVSQIFLTIRIDSLYKSVNQYSLSPSSRSVEYYVGDLIRLHEFI
jgi:hypothetical protein